MIIISGRYTTVCNNGKQEPAHRVVAERYLKRKLKDEEEVHHIDEDKSNNKIENLIVFETHGHHLAYHRKKTFDTFYSPRPDKRRPIKKIKQYYLQEYGIVLYGPFYRKKDNDLRNKLIEKTKRDLGII